MGCFEKLVKSKFLTNISKELDMAREAVKSMSLTHLPPQILPHKKDRKALYDEYVYELMLLEEIEDTILEGMDPKFVYYMQADQFLYVYSQNQQLVKDAIMYAYNLNGDWPIYKARHRFGSVTIHAVLLDTRFEFIPASPN